MKPSAADVSTRFVLLNMRSGLSYTLLPEYRSEKSSKVRCLFQQTPNCLLYLRFQREENPFFTGLIGVSYHISDLKKSYLDFKLMINHVLIKGR